MIDWYTYYSPTTGEIIGAGTSEEEHLVANTPSGFSAIQGEYNSREGFVEDGEFVAYTVPQILAKMQRPKHRCEWSNESFSWVDIRDLEEVRTDRMRLLKAARDDWLNGGFSWDGSVFDSDLVSQTRLLGLKIKAQNDPATSETWRLQDNSWRTLSATDALAVWTAFETHLRQAFLTFALKEAQVMAAQTTAEVEAVEWN